MNILSVAERESLMSKLVASGFFGKEDTSAFSNDELDMAVDLIVIRESVLDPDTGFMDSDDFTELMGRKPVGRLDQEGKHTVAELKNATGFVHGEAVKRAPRFVLDLKSAAYRSGMDLAREFVPNVVKGLHAAMNKVARFPEVPSDILRAYVISTANTVEGVRADTLRLLENLAGLGYQIYNPGGHPDIEDRHADGTMGYKDIAVKFVKDAPDESDPVVREVLVLQPNMLRQKKLLDGLYDVIREANKRLLAETGSDRQMTITQTRDKFDRRVKQLSAKAYSEDNSPGSPTRIDRMTASDFPAGTKFFIKDADGPYAIVPGPRPVKFRTFSYASGAKASSAATGVNLVGREVSVEGFLAEVSYCARDGASPSGGPSVEKSPAVENLPHLRSFIAEARHCAEAMQENANFVQNELPNVHLDDSLKADTIRVCTRLIGTKFDIVTELSELDELIASHATDQAIASRVERILDRIRQAKTQMHELVMAVRTASDQNPAYGLASTLITESAVNILNVSHRAKEAADSLVIVHT